MTMREKVVLLLKIELYYPHCQGTKLHENSGFLNVKNKNQDHNVRHTSILISTIAIFVAKNRKFMNIYIGLEVHKGSIFAYIIDEKREKLFDNVTVHSNPLSLNVASLRNLPIVYRSLLLRRGEASGKMPEAFGKMPEAFGKMPEASGKMPEASGKMPEASGKMPEAFGKMPEAFGKMPEASGKMPEAFGKIFFKKMIAFSKRVSLRP
jgi:uncharacterized protein YjbJ (UPF0337 family)